MKELLRVALACLVTLTLLDANAQRAKNGNYTVTALNQVLNTYTTLTSNETPGQTVITVASATMTGGAFGATALQQGDLILIIQMYGGTVDVNTSPYTGGWGDYTLNGAWPATKYTFGQMLSYENAGKFERREVLSVSGNNITLTCGLSNTYTAANKVQVVRIPRFNDLTVNAASSIIPSAWNGTTGGIVALEVNGTLNMVAGSLISASSMGFRGGATDNTFTAGAASTTFPYLRFLGSLNAAYGSAKGEGIYGFTPEYTSIYSTIGYGAIGNGGGGGAFVNAGGGGGSNADVAPIAYNGAGNPVGYATAWALDLEISSSSGGGRGGYALSQASQNPTLVGPDNASWSGDGRKNCGGYGGHPLTYDATRMFFGGGGGAGDQDSGQGGGGGTGGGIVYLINYGTVTGTGIIEVNGQKGLNSNPLNQALGFNAYKGNDGAGGGGAAGTVYIENKIALPNTITINARGGDGGDQALQVNAFQPNEAGGPGGSGTGGVIRFSSGAPTQSAAAGVNGVTTSTQMANFPPNGASTGAVGEINLPTTFFDLTPTNATICAGQSATVSVAVVGTAPGTINWYTVQFGGTPIVGQSGQLSYTVSPATTTTYYVGTCPSSFRVPVTVTVTPAPTLITTDPAPICAPGTVNITLPAITAGSGAGTLTYWQNNTATISQPTPTAVGAGWHYIKLDDGGPCTTLDSVFVTINPLDNASFNYSAASYCTNASDPTPTITGLAGGTFTSSPAGLSINSSNGVIDVSASTPGAYTVTYTTSGSCPNSSNVSVTINAVSNASFNYSAASYCANASDPTPTITGLAGGTFSSSPAGLSINTSTGVIDVSASTPGAYTVTYTTGSTCPNSSNVAVTIDALQSAAFTLTATCVGGTATITGTAGGSFAFNPAPGDGAVVNTSTGTITNGTVGTTYFVEYTTAGPCAASSIQSVTAATDLAYTSTLTDENCGAGDGIIDLVASGGDGGPYQYSITGGAPYFASGNFTGLSAAGYTISILDNSGCEITGSETISSTGGPTINSVVVSEPSCPGVCDGSITITVSGGTAPYTYQWFDNLMNPIGTDSPILSGQCAGNYSVEVTDAAGGGAQLYFEDFEGAHGWNLNVVTGAEGADANFFVVNDNEGGVLPSGCGVAGNGDNTLHVTSVFFPSGGAAYDAGGLCGILFCPETNRRSESPVINTVGQTGLTLNFDFISNGQAGSDFATVWYNDGLGWTQLGAALSSPVCGGGQGQWTAYSSALPASCENIANLQIAIQWQNNDDGIGTDPSVAVNNIEVVASSVGCPSYANATLTDPAPLNLTTTDPAPVCAPGTANITLPAVTAGSDAGTLTYWQDNLATISEPTPTAVGAGWHYIQLDNGGPCSVIDSVFVTVNPLDDASFTSADFCASSVNTISGVATPGGTFSIQSQTGSGLATINASTGVLANFAAGDQITILYTTPAAGCQNTSTQVVNVTSLDDASFSSSDFCESSVNTISGVATPGGTFSIQSQTGSGLATINGSTGVLANYVAGDQITIQYQTPAGGCQNTSTQVVNVTGLDDASFTSVDFCESGVNTISSVATAGGTFSIQSQTGSGLATINASTGVLANFVAGDQITIQYQTPAGGCQNSSTQVVNVNPLDDASFTSADFCVNSTNTISGVATAGGTYSIQSQTGSGLATINASTGVLANFAAGDQITILYTTPAAGCQNTSTQVVNVTSLDDASFTSSDFCESSVNTISGVATPGGTFSIQSQTGSGLATINGSTGVLANYVAGDQITIQYQTPAGGCQNTSTQVVNVTNLDDASFTSTDFCESTTNTISAVATAGGTFTIQSQTGSGLATINASTGVLANFAAGDQITIQYQTPAGGCQNSSTQVVNVNPLDDASFTSADFCANSTNTISGVATAGGTYSIQSQTGSGLATINASTGVLANFAAGDQITILYTTPAAGCQNTSTQVVNVTSLDDASFSSSDFCESSVNTIFGVATPGGTFSIQSQTGSGLATINGSTGVLANYTAGDQITIQYQTPAGGCQNTSTQVVNVTSVDDASFTSADFCESNVNTISGVATPGGTFSIQSQTGSATINASTGVLSNAAGGDQITIEYTTPAGSCQNTSTQVVNVISDDDATFALTATCDGATALVSGTAGGTFTFATSPGDAAVINSASGTISGGTPGALYGVLYTTNGACPVAATQVVTVLDADDPSFTATPTCDGSTALVSGTTGGTFALLNSSGSAVIDPATGTVTNAAYNDTYDIEYTTNGTCPETQVLPVMVLDCTPQDLIIPTAFTPGADGAHDTWEIVGLDLVYPDSKIIVYNRWGNQVFEHNASASTPYASNQWDGTYKGQPLPVASYFYVIEPNDGSGKKFEGTITILR